MKPLYLSIQGINSFNEKQEVFFDRLQESGLFCICGPTGSGKTTIFDSIVLSLYGKGGRGRISDYINLSCFSGEVIFEFESSGTVYRVERSFYRDGGKPSKCVLWDKTGGKVLADTVSTADQKLKGIIGLLKDEFTQVALIEQGKFGEFLSADKSSRNVIVGNLFRLDRFKNLYERFNSKKTVLAANTEMLNEQIREFEIFSDEYSSSLSKSIEEIKNKKAHIEADIKNYDLELDKQRNIRHEWSRINEARKKLEDTKHRHTLLLNEINEQQVKLKKIDEFAAIALSKKQNVQTNRQLLGTLEGIKHTYALKKATEEKQKGIEQKIKNNKAAIVEGEKRLTGLYENLESICLKIKHDIKAAKLIYNFDTDAVFIYLDRLEKINYAKNEVFLTEEWDTGELRSCLMMLQKKVDGIDSNKKKLLNEIKVSGGELIEVQSALFRENEIWSKSITEANFLKSSIEKEEQSLADLKVKLKEAQLRDQASLIRSKLASGDSCPVCGGIVTTSNTEELPAKANVIEAELNEAEAALNEHRNLLAKVEKVAALSGVKIENAKEKELYLRGVIKKSEDSLKELLSDVLNGDELQKLMSTLISASECLSKTDKLISVIKNLRLEIDALYLSFASLSSELSVTEKEISEMLITIEKITKGEDLIAMEKRIAEEINSDTNYFDRFERTRQEVERVIREKTNLMAGIEGEIKSINEISQQNLEFDEQNFEKLQKIREMLESDKSSFTKELITTELAIKDAEVKLEKKKRLQEQIKTIADKTDKLSLILKIIKGDRFLEFVAEEYIIRFTYAASQILSKISSGKYTLEYLDGVFYVRDFLLNNELRRASTLSGGETFLASLALAIAITGEISGYKSFEFFFLDEGFGTLDAESIEIVYEAIETLSKETLVGIITHRSELVDKISSRITLTPADEKSGSRITHTF